MILTWCLLIQVQMLHQQETLDEKELYLSIGKFQRLFGMSNFLVVDNNKSDLELTTLTMNRVSKVVRKLISAPIQSYTAKRWMASERKARRR